MFKKIISILMGLLFVVSGAIASDSCPAHQQGNQKGRVAEFMEQKKAFLIKEVAMTQEEAKAFFPLYEDLQKKKFALHRALREKIKEVKEGGEAVSDDEYRALSKAMVDTQLKEAQLDSDYYNRFSKILSPKKLYKLQVAENDFNREMMKRPPRHGETRKGGSPAK